MPKRRTPKQRAASKRNLVKARAAKKPVGKSEMINLFHRTKPASADSIVKAQKFIPKVHGGNPKGVVFFQSDRKNRGNGEGVVNVRVSKAKVKLVEDFGSTAVYTATPKSLGGAKIRKGLT